MTQPLRIGLLRLVDSAPVIVAEAAGLFRAHGLDVRISIEPSWANIADKLAYGVLDAAVMLPPLALAASAGLRGMKARLLVPMSLSQGGNAITVRTDIAHALTSPAAPQRIRLLEWLHAQPDPPHPASDHPTPAHLAPAHPAPAHSTPPRFAVVHTFSTHNLLLRYWLASSGADPDRDIETVVIPPEQVGHALAAGEIAGFCAGAPWGDAAERAGTGQVLLGTSAIWPFHPEKCLCVNEPWAEANPETLRRLLQALLRAQMRCDQPEQADAIAGLLADPGGLALPRDSARTVLPGGTGTERIRFHARAAWFPARAHAAWFIGQMQRWGWMPADLDADALVRQVYRPDLLAPALEAQGLYRADALPALEGSVLLPTPEQDPSPSDPLRPRHGRT